jgi:hypothetical protein
MHAEAARSMTGEQFLAMESTLLTMRAGAGAAIRVRTSAMPHGVTLVW